MFMAPRPTSRFCGRFCAWYRLIGPEASAQAARASAKARGDKQRGRGKIGYVKRGGRHEHRVLVEAQIGRRLTFNEVVHHIDGNKHNNDLSNLVVLTRQTHMREHGLGIPGMKLWWKPWEYRQCK